MRKLRGAMVAFFLMGSPLVARAQTEAQPEPQRVGITQLPPAVQDTFLAEIGNGRVENLRKAATTNGERFAGEVITDGQVIDISVDSNGVVKGRAQPRDETSQEKAQDR